MTIVAASSVAGFFNEVVEDAMRARPDGATIFLSLKDEIGIDDVVAMIREKALFK